MNICACSSEVCTHWPSPETSRSSSAVRMPMAQNRPAVRSATGMPTRIGPSPGAPVVIGAVLAEAGDRTVDDTWIDLAHALIVDAELALDVRAEVLDHHVGLLDQAVEPLKAFRVLQVERDRPFVAMQVL